jgi:hypothetical protein
MSLKDINKILAAAQTDLVFSPTPDMRRAKAAFWSRFAEAPMVPSDTITLASIQNISSDKRLSKWWTLPGFAEWFQNREEFRERLEYLADVALDALEQVLTDPDANAGAKVNSAKLVLEAASKMPKKIEDSPVSRLEALSRAELEDYVRRNLKYLSSPEPLTNSQPPDTVDESTELPNE